MVDSILKHNRIIIRPTPDFPSQGQDFFGKKSLMKLPVAVSKPRKGKIRRGAFKKAMVMFYLVANQGASHPHTASHSVIPAKAGIQKEWTRFRVKPGMTKK